MNNCFHFFFFLFYFSIIVRNIKYIMLPVKNVERMSNTMNQSNIPPQPIMNTNIGVGIPHTYAMTRSQQPIETSRISISSLVASSNSNSNSSTNCPLMTTDTLEIHEPTIVYPPQSSAFMDHHNRELTLNSLHHSSMSNVVLMKSINSNESLIPPPLHPPSSLSNPNFDITTNSNSSSNHTLTNIDTRGFTNMSMGSSSSSSSLANMNGIGREESIRMTRINNIIEKEEILRMDNIGESRGITQINNIRDNRGIIGMNNIRDSREMTRRINNVPENGSFIRMNSTNENNDIMNRFGNNNTLSNINSISENSVITLNENSSLTNISNFSRECNNLTTFNRISECNSSVSSINDMGEYNGSQPQINRPINTINNIGESSCSSSSCCINNTSNSNNYRNTNSYPSNSYPSNDYNNDNSSNNSNTVQQPMPNINLTTNINININKDCRSIPVFPVNVDADFMNLYHKVSVLDSREMLNFLEDLSKEEVERILDYDPSLLERLRDQFISTGFKNKKKAVGSNEIPRPLNAFMIYRRHMIEQLNPYHLKVKYNDMHTDIAKYWHKEPQEVKNQYKSKSNIHCLIHSRL